MVQELALNKLMEPRCIELIHRGWKALLEVYHPLSFLSASYSMLRRGLLDCYQICMSLCSHLFKNCLQAGRQHFTTFPEGLQTVFRSKWEGTDGSSKSLLSELCSMNQLCCIPRDLVRNAESQAYPRPTKIDATF